MKKYEIVELLESAKINFKTSRRVPAIFDCAVMQLDEAIKALEGDEDGK